MTRRSFSRRLDVEAMQHAVKDRRQHEAGGDDDDETGQDRVGTGEDFSRLGLEFADRAHAGQDHRGIHIGIGDRHALEIRIARHADGEADEGQHRPQPDGDQHPACKFAARSDRMAAMFEAGHAESVAWHSLPPAKPMIGTHTTRQTAVERERPRA